MKHRAPTLEYLTIQQAATILHRKPYGLWRAVHDGTLRAFQPGGEGPHLIRPDDLRTYVRKRPSRTSR